MNLISAFSIASWRGFWMTMPNRSAPDAPATAEPDKTPHSATARDDDTERRGNELPELQFQVDVVIRRHIDKKVDER